MIFNVVGAVSHPLPFVVDFQASTFLFLFSSSLPLSFFFFIFFFIKGCRGKSFFFSFRFFLLSFSGKKTGYFETTLNIIFLLSQLSFSNLQLEFFSCFIIPQMCYFHPPTVVFIIYEKGFSMKCE